MLVARRKDRLDALAKQLGNARAVALTSAQPGAAARLMADLAAHGEHGRDADQQCRLRPVGASSSRSTAPRQREMIDLNCGALVELCHMVAAGPMVERGDGAILNVASTAAFQPGPGMATYFATKAFVL